MSKDKTIFSFKFRLIQIILFFLYISPIPIKYAFADGDDYLATCDNFENISDKDLKKYWTNYPEAPGGDFDTSKNCLPARYCSDIRLPSIKIGAFYYNDDGELQYEDERETITVNGICAGNNNIPNEDDERLIVTDNFNKTEKKVLESVGALPGLDVVEDGISKCKLTYKVPKIFYGLKQYTQYCYSTTDNDGETTVNCVYEKPENITEYQTFETIKYDEFCKKSENSTDYKCVNKPPKLYYESEFDKNGDGFEDEDYKCYLKSCSDLTTDELEGIRSYIESTVENKDNSFYINLRQFCMPKKYNGVYSISNANIKYYVNSTDEDLDVYCNEFNDAEALKYLITQSKYLGYFNKNTNKNKQITVDLDLECDENGKVVGDDEKLCTDVTSTDTQELNTYYQCKLHQCPLTDGQSRVICSSNFSLLNNKGEDYINNYQTYITETNETDLTNLPCSEISCEQNGMVETLYYQCTETKSEDSTGLIKTEYVLNSRCDTYEGIPNELATDNESQYKSLTDGQSVQVCDNSGYCKRTIDFNIAKFSNENSAEYLANECKAETEELTNKIKDEESSSETTNNEEVKGPICSLIEDDTDTLSEEGKTDAMDKNIEASEESLKIMKGNEEDALKEKAQKEKELKTSYFYRPIPPAQATELVYVDSDGKIYSYEDGEGCPKGKICTKKTIMKRILSGQSVDDQQTENLHNYFKYIENGVSSDYDGRANICATKDNKGAEFKQYRFYEKYANKFEEFFDFPKKKYGEYYSGYWGTDRNVPHIIPLCGKEKPSIKPWTKSYMCGNDGYICNAPYWDSYYYLGDPTVEWSDTDAKPGKITATVCLRTRHPTKGICGDRECDVDCGAGRCSLQSCANDRCVTLTYVDGCNCSLQNIANWKKNGTEQKKCGSCISEVMTDGVRFRANKIGNKFYVFLDVTDTACTTAHKYMNHIDMGRNRNEVAGPDSNTKPSVDKNSNGSDIISFDDSNTSTIGYKEKSSFGGTIRGKMDENSLVDSNDLIDYDGDGKITDKDVFGEYLYTTLDCENNKNSEDCLLLGAANGKNPPVRDVGTQWITWDIVQYIGNNQPQDGENCKVGSLNNCRGYYDAEGKFYPEQQGFIVPLSTSPNFFYKYATIDNSPDLFIPILQVVSVYTDNSGDPINLSTGNIDEDSLFLDYFEPKIGIKYGDKSVDEQGNEIDVQMGFADVTTQGEIKTDFRGETICTSYRLTKTATVYPSPQPKVCLSQVFTCEDYGTTDGTPGSQQIRCFFRSNPDIENFLIQPGDITGENPYVYAYFRKNVDQTDINLNDEKNIVNFYSTTDESLISQDKNKYRQLVGNNTAFSQKYPIYLSKSDCSVLHYDCILVKKKYMELEDENKTVDTDDEMRTLSNELSICEQAESACAAADGNISLVQKVAGEGDDKSHVVLKMRADIDGYNINGSENNICVTSGFESYTKYVVAYPSVGSTVGKCILEDESKKDENCRRKEVYQFCKGDETGNPTSSCQCLDGTDTCNCSDGSSCISTISCECSGDDCLDLNPACYLPGFNTLGTLLDKDGKLANSCKCILYENPNSAGANTETRKATPRELGLCVDLQNTVFCEPVKYYDSAKRYKYGNDYTLSAAITNNKGGDTVDILDNDLINSYASHIWRSQQKMYGKYYFDLGNAEFDKTTADCSDTNSDRCLTRKICYKKNADGTVSKCGSDSEGLGCTCEYLQTGTCNGFWKNSGDVSPLATCTSVKTNDGETVGVFKLIEGTECERYTCPAIDENNVVLDSEIENNKDDKSSSSINIQGKSNGFATWAAYTKGTEEVDDEPSPNDKDKNAYGDTIEQRTAENCLQGFGPAGLNSVLYNYMPILKVSDIKSSDKCEIDANTTIEDIITNPECNNEVFEAEDTIIKKIIGYNYNDAGFDKTSFEEYITTNIGGYNAREHLPVRYCSQLGNWMTVEDIYNTPSTNGLLYYVGNEAYNKNNKLDGYGFLSADTIKEYGYTGYSDRFEKSIFNYDASNTNSIPDNTYGQDVEYREKYCERLFCRGYESDEIGLLSVESSDADNTLVNYPNSATSNNYPKVEHDSKDTRTNTVVNNKYTTWRHLGGATWPETPAPRDPNDEFAKVDGTCDINKGFYPASTTFIGENVYEDSNGEQIYTSGFINQFNNLFTSGNPSTSVINMSEYSDTTFGGNIQNNGKVENIKDKNKENSKGSVFVDSLGNSKPQRYCSKWGIWSDIENKCVATCKPIDAFRTCYNDFNDDGFLQNYEILALFRTVEDRANYNSNICEKLPEYKDLKSSTKNSEAEYGDSFTGGAQWPLSAGGTIVYGECDTVSSDVVFIRQDYEEYLEKLNANNGITNLDSIDIIKNSINNNKDGYGNSGVKDNYGNDVKFYDDNDSKIGIGITAVNNRPFRVCQQDGTWSPVYNPCVRANVCSSQDLETDDLLALNSYSEGDINDHIQDIKTNDNTETVKNTKSIGQLTVTIDTNEYRNLTSSSRIPASKGKDTSGNNIYPSCDSNIFISGEIKSYCNIGTGQWENTSATCLLKTCSMEDFDEQFGESERKIYGGNGTTIVPELSDGKLYYLKSSGYTGPLTLKGENNTSVSYEGYKVELECPTGYVFVKGGVSIGNSENSTESGNNAESGSSTTNSTAIEGDTADNKVVYTCDVSNSSDSKPRWVRTGQCVPAACGGEELEEMVAGGEYGIISGYFKIAGDSSIETGPEIKECPTDSAIYNGSCYDSVNKKYVVGTKIELNCQSGYSNRYEAKDTNSNDVYAECIKDTDSQGNQIIDENGKPSYRWRINGRCGKVCRALPEYAKWVPQGTFIAEQVDKYGYKPTSTCATTAFGDNICGNKNKEKENFSENAFIKYENGLRPANWKGSPYNKPSTDNEYIPAVIGGITQFGEKIITEASLRNGLENGSVLAFVPIYDINYMVLGYVKGGTVVDLACKSGYAEYADSSDNSEFKDYNAYAICNAETGEWEYRGGCFKEYCSYASASIENNNMLPFAKGRHTEVNIEIPEHGYLHILRLYCGAGGNYYGDSNKHNGGYSGYAEGIYKNISDNTVKIKVILGQSGESTKGDTFSNGGAYNETASCKGGNSGNAGYYSGGGGACSAVFKVDSSNNSFVESASSSYLIAGGGGGASRAGGGGSGGGNNGADGTKDSRQATGGSQSIRGINAFDCDDNDYCTNTTSDGNNGETYGDKGQGGGGGGGYYGGGGGKGAGTNNSTSGGGGSGHCGNIEGMKQISCSTSSSAVYTNGVYKNGVYTNGFIEYCVTGSASRDNLPARPELVEVDYGVSDTNFWCRAFLEKGKEYTCDNNLCGDPAPGTSKKCNSPGATKVYAQENETFTP